MARFATAVTLFAFLSWATLATQVLPASFTEIRQHAESGDAQAQFELGRSYEDGKGTEQDDARAVEWFRKSAEQGNAHAQNSMGVMYALGRGVSRDKEEAVRWYKKSAKQGLAEGIYNVAISYYNGEGVDENIGLAYTWMMLAQRRGDSQAAEAMKRIGEQLNNRLDRSKFDLANLYEKGDEVPQDLSAAVALYLQAANLDHRQSIFAGLAQYKMCQLYVAGRGVPQDYAQAKEWCKKSDVGFAYVVLGRMAERGLGGNKDPGEALDQYRKAAILGVPDGYLDTARLHLASGSHDGQKQAYFWYAIAARYKFSGAADKLSEAASHLNEKEIAEQQKQVNDWLKMPSSNRTAELKKH
jgi:TPR repeat protein